MRARSWQYGAKTALLAATAALLLSATPACNGTLGDPYGNGDGAGAGSEGAGAGSGVDPEAQVAAHSQFPRLSHAQWERTIVDLFHLDGQTGFSASFTPDPLGGKAFDNNEASLRVTPGLWADYQRAAEEIAQLVTSDPALLANILPDNLPDDPAAKKAAFLASFGKRVFRRPLTKVEIEQYSALFEQSTTLYPTVDAFTGGVRLSIEALLQSPYFVYRPELGTLPRLDGLIPLSGYEVATRLSYALWSSMPDDDLFAAADAGKLDSLAGIEAEARRLIASERAHDTLISFHDQLYDAEQYLTVNKDAGLYPDFDPAVGEDMRKELSLFVEHVLFAQKGGLEALLTSRTTFVNARLAKIYGLDASGMSDDAFVQVELPAAERAGLLTRSGFLAWKGTKTQPDSILRGVFINRRILCQELGDPPPEAMGAMLGQGTTNREKVTLLTGKGTCGESCHGSFINPAGFSLEHYGALGEYRTEDNGQLINAADTYTFQGGNKQSYDGAVEFSKAAAEAEQSHKCYARYWLEYLYGRDKKSQDAGLLSDLAKLSADGASVQDMVVALVTSDSFLTRAPEEVKP